MPRTESLMARKKRPAPPATRPVFRVSASPAFIAWMRGHAEHEGMTLAAEILGRYAWWIMVLSEAEAIALADLFAILGDQTWYAGQRGSSFRGYAVRRIDRRMRVALGVGV